MFCYCLVCPLTCSALPLSYRCNSPSPRYSPRIMAFALETPTLENIDGLGLATSFTLRRASSGLCTSHYKTLVGKQKKCLTALAHSFYLLGDNSSICGYAGWYSCRKPFSKLRALIGLRFHHDGNDH